MKVKIKKLNQNAVIPKYAQDGDAGLDLTAVSMKYDEHGNIVYGTGLSIEIPDGYVGYIYPRSSISKFDLLLANSVGVIDSNYRGEIIFKFKPSACFGDYHSDKTMEEFENSSDYVALPQINGSSGIQHKGYSVGDRIGQIIIMPIPSIEFEEVEALSNTNRGVGGFGSTGK